MSAYLATLAAAILTGSGFARWIGRASAAGAVLVLGGDLPGLVSDAAFVAVLLGFALLLLVTAAMGVTMWRQARRTPAAGDQGTGRAVTPAQLQRPGPHRRINASSKGARNDDREPRGRR